MDHFGQREILSADVTGAKGVCVSMHLCYGNPDRVAVELDVEVGLLLVASCRRASDQRSGRWTAVVLRCGRDCGPM